MANRLDHLHDINRIWNNQVLDTDPQRSRRTRQCAECSLQTDRQRLQNAYRKISAVEQGTRLLHQKISVLEARHSKKPTDYMADAICVDELLIHTHQLGLRLAQARNVHPGPREKIELQLKAQGF